MLDDEIKKEIEKFDGLIDEEAARLLAMERMGEIELIKVGELKEGKGSFYAKIESLWAGEKMAKAVVGDETGHCLLNFWHQNVDVAKGLREGEVIKVVNAWIKEGKCGIEANVGKFGMVEKVNREIETRMEFGIKEGIFNLKGTIQRIYPTEVYLGEREYFVRKIVVDLMEVYLLNERAKDMQNFNEGDEVLLLWLCKKNGRIYANELSKILRSTDWKSRKGNEKEQP